MQKSFVKLLLRSNSVFSCQRTERDGLIDTQAVFLCSKLFFAGFLFRRSASWSVFYFLKVAAFDNPITPKFFGWKSFLLN